MYHLTSSQNSFKIYHRGRYQTCSLIITSPPCKLARALIPVWSLTPCHDRNYTRYPIYEPSFRTSYEAICNNGIRVHPNDIRFLPLLFVVLAIAARLAPEHILGDERQKRLTSLRYYWSSEPRFLSCLGSPLTRFALRRPALHPHCCGHPLRFVRDHSYAYSGMDFVARFPEGQII